MLFFDQFKKGSITSSYFYPMIVDFASLSEAAKIWIYPSSRRFYPNEVHEIQEKVKNFVSTWKQGGEKSKCSYQFLYRRFIIIAIDDEKCSITKQDINLKVAFILSLQNTYKVELLDRMNVCFKQGNYVQYKALESFKKLLKDKALSAKTIVFDNLISRKCDFENCWELTIEESWYSRFL